MPIVVNKTKTKIFQRPGGWIRVVHETGEKDSVGNPVTVAATITQASIEQSAGVLLPKARVKAICEAALNGLAALVEQEMAAL